MIGRDVAHPSEAALAAGDPNVAGTICVQSGNLAGWNAGRRAERVEVIATPAQQAALAAQADPDLPRSVLQEIGWFSPSGTRCGQSTPKDLGSASSGIPGDDRTRVCILLGQPDE